MKKDWKIGLLFVAGLVLVGCNSQSTHSNQETTDSITEEVEIEQIEIDAFDPLIVDNLFMDSDQNDAWIHYKEVTKYYTLEVSENLDGSGSTAHEITEMMTDIAGKDIDLAYDQYSDGTEMLQLVYPLDTSEEERQRQNYSSAITFYFMDNQLIFSSLTPNVFILREDDLYDIEETYFNVTKLEDLTELTPIPQVFGVSEYNYFGELLRQVLIPTLPDQEWTDDETGMISFIFYEDIVADLLAGRFATVRDETFAGSSYATFRSLDFTEESDD